jgi:tetratricopeptide (TPR) repeat protein
MPRSRRSSMCPTFVPRAMMRGVALLLLLGSPSLITAQRPQVAQGDPEGERRMARIAAGDSAWARGARDTAYAHYAAVVRRGSPAPTRIVFRLAALSAERNALAEAVRLYREYVAREPRDAAGRVALARALAWQGRHGEAVATYDSVLATWPRDRDAVLGRAQVLAWANRHAEALRAYTDWLAQAPEDGEAVRARALTLAWAGRLTDAEVAYREHLARAPDAEAARGLARVLAWRGDLEASVRAWRDLVHRDSADAEAWLGLAEALHWDGRAGEAAPAIAHALALAPSRADLRALRDIIDADRRASAEPVAQHSRDSDGNIVHVVALTMQPRQWGGVRWRVTGGFRDAADATRSGTAATGRLQAAWATAGRGLALVAELGATRLASRPRAAALGFTATAATRPWLTARASTQPVRALALGLAFSAVPFDETALLIARGVHTRAIEGDAALTLPGRVSLGLAGGHLAVLGGQVPNTRAAITTSVRWAADKATSLGVAWRQVAWDTLGRSDGYFAPDHFGLLELSARRVVGRELGWRLTVDGGIGRQQIRFTPDADSRATVALRGTVGVQYAPRAGYAIELVGGATSVASAVTQGDSEYRQHVLSLRGRAPVF